MTTIKSFTSLDEAMIYVELHLQASLHMNDEYFKVEITHVNEQWRVGISDGQQMELPLEKD